MHDVLHRRFPWPATTTITIITIMTTITTTTTITARNCPRPSFASARWKPILTEKGYIDPAALDAIIEAYETKIGPHNGARVVAKAWTDPGLQEGAARGRHQGDRARSATSAASATTWSRSRTRRRPTT